MCNLSVIKIKTAQQSRYIQVGAIREQINMRFLVKTLKSVPFFINIPFIGHRGKV